MKKPCGKRKFLIASVLLTIGGVSLMCCLWVRAAQRQSALNRQLVAALMKDESAKVPTLVEAGADPNTPVETLPIPSVFSLLHQLFHRSPRPIANRTTAFFVVCGAEYPYDGGVGNTIFCEDGFIMAKAMIQHGARLNGTDADGETALMWASNSDLTDVMALLLQNGVAIDLQDNFGDTALHHAVRQGYPAAVGTLLTYHANVHTKNSDGETPLRLASTGSKIGQEREFREIIRLLKQAGATE